jgi:hypothetical protein
MVKLASILVRLGKVDACNSFARVCGFNAFHALNFGSKAAFTIDILTNFTPIKTARNSHNTI